MSKDAEVGLVALRDGMRLWHSTGASIGVPYWKALLSDVLVKCNDFEGATVALDEAVICMDSTNEKWFEPEIHRRRGELLLISAEDDVGAEAAFKQACKTARATGAVAFERQALMSLRDLLTKAERSDDAQHVEAALQSLDVSGPSTSGGRP